MLKYYFEQAQGEEALSPLRKFHIFLSLFLPNYMIDYTIKIQYKYILCIFENY